MHLHIIRESEKESERNLLNIFSPQSHDFRWNDDFTAYRPIKLAWHDDASYIAYQSDSGQEGGDTFYNLFELPIAQAAKGPDCSPPKAEEDDGICF